MSHPCEVLARRLTSSLQLHVDYLSAHSSLLRALFSGSSPLDLITSSNNLQQTCSAPSRTPAGQFAVPANRLPRLMPCSADHPILFLPVPDPTSIHLLVHWMYFGRTEYIEEALNEGSIEWEGIARNVEYLGLPAEMKVFLGLWYGDWLHHERAHSISDDDSDTVYSDEHNDHDNEDDSDSSISSSLELDPEIDDGGGLKEPARGRTTATRPLSLSMLSPSSA